MDPSKGDERRATDANSSDELMLQAELDGRLIARLQEQAAADAATIDQLRTALQTCRRIGAAIGIIMATTKVTEDQAFARLSQASQRGNCKLRDVADDVVLTGEL